MNRFFDLFEIIRFPSGERHVRFLRDAYYDPSAPVVADHVRTLDDLCDVVVANGVLEGQLPYGKYPSWLIPFFPGARMDRRESALDGSHLQLALKLVEGMDVTIVDPHSYVSAALSHYDQAAVIKASGGMFSHITHFLIPDQGAVKKADKWLVGRMHTVCQKHRDPGTGRLSGFQVNLHPPGTGSMGPDHYMIVDDICDGGGTFLGIAEAMKGHLMPGDTLSLCVTHGLFTKGTDELFKSFDNIYTLDCYTNNVSSTVYSQGKQKNLIPIKLADVVRLNKRI